MKDSRPWHVAGFPFPAETREQIREPGSAAGRNLRSFTSNVPMNGSCAERNQAARWRMQP